MGARTQGIIFLLLGKNDRPEQLLNYFVNRTKSFSIQSAQSVPKESMQGSQAFQTSLFQASILTCAELNTNKPEQRVFLNSIKFGKSEF